MKKLFLLVVTLSIYIGQAQAQQYTSTKDNDPAAKAVLDKLKKKYESFQTLFADFQLEIEIPEVTTETQKGQLWQMGDKYRAELDNRSIISDGQNVWVYLGNNKEVQINCANEFAAEGMMSPKDLLTVYEQEEFVYYLSNEFREENKTVQQIEFKPTDKDSEYSKLRLTVDKKTTEVVRMKVFSKEGSRFTLKMNSFTPNQKINANKFMWQQSECPDCYVEDLRIDDCE